MQPRAFMFFLAASSMGVVATVNAVNGTVATPVEKVVKLLSKMKTDVEAEAKEDDANYKKYACWCKTSSEDHTAQVEEQKQAIDEVNADIEQGVTSKARLEADIKSHTESIAGDKEALAGATAFREEAAAAHSAEAADLNGTIGLLDQAIAALSKVQLLQESGKSLRATPLKPMLSDLHDKVQAIGDRIGRYHNAMQKDLWAFVGSLEDALGGDALFPSSSAALTQQSNDGRTNVPAIPGASSYSARSNSVYGMLEQMAEDCKADLVEAVQAEASAQAQFDELKKTLLAKIATSSAQLDRCEEELADTNMKLMEDRWKLEDITEALGKDEKFLVDLAKACATSADDYEERTAARNEEIRALGEATSMLMQDDARDMFSQALTLFQTDQFHHHSKSSDAADQGQHQDFEARAAAQHKLMRNAFRQVLHTAKLHQNWALASLAVRVGLDDFTKAKKALDGMLSELKAQQAAETAKRDECARDIDLKEDEITVATNEKEDLEGTKLGLESELATLGKEKGELQESVSLMQVELKSGSEARKKEQEEFQKAVMDQRETANILLKTVERLKMFYAPKSLLQVRQHDAVRDDPPAVQKYTVHYEKHEAYAGVMELLNMIINDASKMEAELTTNEQNAQDSYAVFVNDCMATAEANTKAIANAEIAIQKATAGRSATDAQLQTNEKSLNALTSLLGAVHAECDWLLKYYKQRQTARAEEMDAITEAKAILSGADFS